MSRVRIYIFSHVMALSRSVTDAAEARRAGAAEGGPYGGIGSSPIVYGLRQALTFAEFPDGSHCFRFSVCYGTP